MDTNEWIIVDAFEASARSQAVINANDRLLRRFPGRSVTFDGQVLKKRLFVNELTSMLEKMHREEVELCSATTTKASSEVLEPRDTVHPMLVTEHLLSILEAWGQNREPEGFIKHIRDDVNYKDTFLPWRRSPFWLVIRVTLQLLITRSFREHQGRIQYKNFMAYLMAKVCKLTVVHHLRPDIQTLVNNKVIYRLSKLDSNAIETVTSEVTTTVQHGLDYVERAWHQFCERNRTNIARLPSRATEADVTLSLHNSREHLRQAIERSSEVVEIGDYEPPPPARLKFGQNGQPQVDQLEQPDTNLYILVDFEEWVLEKLQQWMKARQSSDRDCKWLLHALQTYVDAGRASYRCNPRALSIMVLVAMTIWIELDKTCVYLYPLLEQYHPEIPETLFEPLLLPHYSQMEAVRRIELYLRERAQTADCNNTRILADPEATSFGTKYFENSPKHHNLRRRIENEAIYRRQRKVDEWREKSAQYNLLEAQAFELSHQYINTLRGWQIHSNVCRKCSLESQANRLSIEVDEWSLPLDEVQLKTAVFELDCPEGFSAWRDATWIIVQNLGRQSLQSAGVEGHLFSYSLLEPFATSKDHTLVLASNTKSFLRSHYRETGFPVELERICVNNGFHYRLLDNQNTAWIGEQYSPPSLYALCNVSLPSGPYSNLASFVNGTQQEHNEVIAGQQNCHKRLSPHEFHAFGSLRSGERLQWLNILRELASAELTFKSEEVHMLVRQAALQLEKSAEGGVLRAAHAVFRDQCFVSQLHSTLQSQMRAIEANWNEQSRLAMLITLNLRIVSLATQESDRECARQLNRELRTKALEWCRHLVDLVDESSDNESCTMLRQKLLRSAALCRMTFDCEKSDTDDPFREAADVEAFVVSSIYLHNHAPVRLEDLSSETLHAFILGKRASRRVQDALISALRRSTDGLNRAIELVFLIRTSSTEWNFPTSRGGGWVMTYTVAGKEHKAQRVFYNTLTGELLLDGEPIGRIPTLYTSTPMYRRLFGSRVLNVSTSSLPGMRYKSITEIESHEIHLGMENEQLVVIAVFHDCLLRLIPHDVFRGDIADLLVDNYFHWMNIESGVIDLRPYETPWVPGSGPELRFRLHGDSFLTLGERKLVDCHSQLGKAISRILLVLEQPGYILATSTPEGDVAVELPRFGLKFRINVEGCLQSRELDAIVDLDQNIDCMIGLHNKLVLSSTVSPALPASRTVLIPYGHAKAEDDHGFPQVHITTGSERKLRFVSYSIDSRLCGLRNGPGRIEKLYRAYLHAHTNSIMPDPLTKLTGTEEAIRILSEQSLFASSPIDDETMLLLNRIAALTPPRKFYPKHLKKMQSAKWDHSLSQLAQNEEFFVAIGRIYSYAEQFQMLHGAQLPAFASRGSQSLLDRSWLRNWSVRGRKSAPREKRDLPYEARDNHSTCDRACRVYEMAALIRDWPTQTNVIEDLVESIRCWNNIHGYGCPPKISTMTYTEALDFPVHRQWGALYDLCRTAERDTSSYALTFMFATIAFAQPEAEITLRTLLGIAFSGKFRNIYPDASEYRICDGHRPDPVRIRSSIIDLCQQFDDPGIGNVSERRQRMLDHEESVAQQVEIAIAHIVKQWPCASADFPGPTSIPLIDVPEARKACNALLRTWHKNFKFIQHIEIVSRSLLSVHTTSIPIRRGRVPSNFAFSEEVPYTREYLDIWRLLSTRIPSSPSPVAKAVVVERPRTSAKLISNRSELHKIIDGMRSNANDTRRNYASDLSESLLAFDGTVLPTTPNQITISEERMEGHRLELAGDLNSRFSTIVQALQPEDCCSKLEAKAGLRPPVSHASLLTCLSANWFRSLSIAWRKHLVSFAQSISLLQRAERLMRFIHCRDAVGFYKEAEDPGHESWDGMEFPDWLLIEVENNLTIRKTQVDVALNILRPESGQNSLLQLNMGEGKSSVIVPMVVCSLADGNLAARLIVLKPLLKQTENLLSQRLGGLVNRRAYHMPFSRRTNLTEEQIEILHRMYMDCITERGVIIALPEHMLSFRLMGRDRLVHQPSLAKAMMKLEDWFQRCCRNILDESDEILDPKFQLVYSMGLQKMIDAQPMRWTLTQAVLSNFVKQAQHLDALEPGLLEIDYKGRSYPTITFLNPIAGDQILDMIVHDIEHGNLLGVQLGHNLKTRQLAVKFVRRRQPLDDSNFQLLKSEFGDTSIWPSLHLLRGLIAYNVLLTAFQRKRWRVHYGLDLDRCMMSVPFRAKRVPSIAAEFSHADIAIVLTCLSFYYEGLDESQLRESFLLLMKESDPPSEYVRWTRDCSDLPERVQSLDAVNLDDHQLWEREIYPHMRFSKSAADFFMSRVVFPHEGKEFPTKLSASAWDIPSSCGQPITTGFSGTNDNRVLLPFSISQDSLPGLLHTNAMMIDLLLRKENRQYLEAKGADGKTLSLLQLVRLICDQSPQVRILIDVGAQVLDVENIEVARRWLEHVHEAEAAVFFDEQDEVMVIDRIGNTDSLRSSPFYHKPESCLFYLDEMHTRGVDLQMPYDARAAVTLGPKLTYSRLAQGT